MLFCCLPCPALPDAVLNSPAGVLKPSPTSLNHRFVLVLTFLPPRALVLWNSCCFWKAFSVCSAILSV